MKVLTVLTVLLCLGGVVISSLALTLHYDTHPAPCSINSVWDCGLVNRSPYSLFYGVPVAMIGIVGYAVIAVLAGRYPKITALLALGALGFALRLTYIEWKVLETWCIYCVTSQSIILVTFLLALAAAILEHRRSRAALPTARA
jgi:vitamin-K-epoxide reductase (warfarin-sensitive)